MGCFKQIAFTLISASALFAASSQAANCTAEINRDSAGKFQSCVVTLAGSEYRMGADESSEGGCSQVCSIMGAVQSAKKGGRIATAMIE